ncbi:MAG TPA: preprotein translocase subunit YajC [Thermodesulfobacteriota bacterium]|nr:preprotein translocase subunit YajC [Thermodesulfobacteriota bacterium]
MKRIIPFIPLLTSFFVGCPMPSEGQEGVGGSPIAALVPFVLIFVLFYFLILRPQQKQSRERQEMLKNLKRGDTVITSGGIYGRILNITGDIITLEIAKGVSVRLSRAGVSGIANIGDEEKKAKEEKSDK